MKLIFLTLIVVLSSFDKTTGQAPQVRLKTDLFGNYHRDLLPHFDKSHDVTLSVSLNAIRGLDLHQGTIELSVLLKLLWNDPRLQWEPQSYSNTTIMRIPASQLWIPDIVLYNSVETTQHIEDVLALVYSDGTVYYLPFMIVKAACNMDLTKYPYDSQVCSFKWGSWTHDSDKISLAPGADKIEVEDYWQSQEWELMTTSIRKHSIKYPCCTEVYEDVTAYIEIRRRHSHGFIANAVITNWMILVVFLISPSTSGERILFLGFIFISLVVQLSSLSTTVSAYMTTSLGRYLLAGLLMTAIVAVINALLFTFYPRPVDAKEIVADARRRFFIFFDLGALVVTTIILAILTGALFGH